MVVKGPKTKYNNKKVAPRIRCYILKYIQNLNKVFTNLKAADITIAGAKSQFYQAGMKIVGYICNATSHHPNTSKVLKIFDLPKYTNITSTCALTGICIYY